MIRRVPLKRSYMKRSPARRIADETPEETAYKEWLHTRPCVATGYVGELIQASHMGEGGMSQKKGTWYDAVPMRADVHAEWGEHRGRFAGWTKERRRNYASEAVTRTYIAYIISRPTVT